MDLPYIALHDEVPRRSWRSQYKFLPLFYLNVFFSCTSFSIVLPSLWPYIHKHGGSDEFLAVVLFVYSLGEILGSLVFGYIYNSCSAKFTFTTCLSTGLIGSFMYLSADYFGGDAGLLLIFTGRFLQGMWTGGQQTAEASYISEVVTPKYKLFALTDIGAIAVFGFVIGPVLDFLMSYVSVNLTDSLRFDQYTGPGYFMTVVNLVMICVFTFRFDEVRREARHSLIENSISDPVPPSRLGVAACMLISLVAFSGFAVQETITTPLVTDTEQVYTDSFDWSVQQACLLYASSSVASVFAFILINQFSGKYDDRKILYYSLALGLVGWLFFVDWVPRQINHEMFLVGYTMVGVAFPISRVVVVNVLSHIIGPNPAGEYMGWILATGGISRCIGPFLAIYSLQFSPRLCFGSTAFLFLLSMGVLSFSWKQCSKHPHSKKKEVSISECT
jgi:ceroid-lipofuscinosis MFS transporter 7